MSDSSKYSFLLESDPVMTGQIDTSDLGLDYDLVALPETSDESIDTFFGVGGIRRARQLAPAPITNLSINSGFNLYFEHVPTGYRVAFPAFITDHSDAFTSNWNEQTVFGRMDPIATFESTKRVSAMGFKVVAYSTNQAASNLNKINKLISFLYPTYTERGGSKVGTTVNMAPLVRIKYGNQITNTDNNKGLLGYITTGITLTPDMEAGVFASSGQPKDTFSGVSGQEYLYKAYNINFELTVLHEHSLGWVQRNTQKGNKEVFVFRSMKGRFPYQTGNANSMLGIANPSIKVPLVAVPEAGAFIQEGGTLDPAEEEINNNVTAAVQEGRIPALQPLATPGGTGQVPALVTTPDLDLGPAPALVEIPVADNESSYDPGAFGPTPWALGSS